MAKTKRDGVAIITGGASGIGRGIGRELARRGVHVVLADRQIAAAEDAAAQIRAAGGRATPVELDVRDADAFEEVAASVERTAGGIDYLFNNAGIGVGGRMETYQRADWDDVIDVNIRGVANGIQAVYPRMIRRGRGHIINTASVAGLVPSGEAGSYTMSKFAVVGVSRALRIEAARHGVKVSVLCPGAIRTPILTGGVYGRMNMSATKEKILEQWEKLRPMDVDAFAPQVIRAVERDEAIIVIPRWWKAIWWMERLAPQVMTRVWAKIGDAMHSELHEDAGQTSDGNGASRHDDEQPRAY